MVADVGAEANRDGPVEEKGTWAFQQEFVNFHLGVFRHQALAERRAVLGAQRVPGSGRPGRAATRGRHRRCTRRGSSPLTTTCASRRGGNVHRWYTGQVPGSELPYPPPGSVPHRACGAACAARLGGAARRRPPVAVSELAGAAEAPAGTARRREAGRHRGRDGGAGPTGGRCRRPIHPRPRRAAATGPRCPTS